MRNILIFLFLIYFSFGSDKFDCSKRYCKEMTSCDEAMHYLQVCGLSKLDRDKDGVPCENVCGGGKKKKRK